MPPLTAKEKEEGSPSFPAKKPGGCGEKKTEPAKKMGATGKKERKSFSSSFPFQNLRGRERKGPTYTFFEEEEEKKYAGRREKRERNLELIPCFLGQKGIFCAGSILCLLFKRWEKKLCVKDLSQMKLIFIKPH